MTADRCPWCRVSPKVGTRQLHPFTGIGRGFDLDEDDRRLKMIVGFGAVGGAMRRRRTGAKLSFA